MLAGRPPSVADLPRLCYTEAVVHESLRLFPRPTPSAGRRSKRASSTATPVPVGTTVLVMPWLLHRDPRYFEAPGEFRPERWLDGLAGSPAPRRLPARSGPGRACASASRSRSWKPRLILAAVARRWRFDLDPGRTRDPVPFDHAPARRVESRRG